MISESLGPVSAVEFVHPREISSLMISESYGLFGLLNPCVTSDISSLIISESLGAVWGVQSLHNT
jgi:hypothetical protein